MPCFASIVKKLGSAFRLIVENIGINRDFYSNVRIVSHRAIQSFFLTSLNRPSHNELYRSSRESSPGTCNLTKRIGSGVAKTLVKCKGRRLLE